MATPISNMKGDTPREYAGTRPRSVANVVNDHIDTFSDFNVPPVPHAQQRYEEQDSVHLTALEKAICPLDHVTRAKESFGALSFSEMIAVVDDIMSKQPNLTNLASGKRAREEFRDALPFMLAEWATGKPVRPVDADATATASGCEEGGD